MKCRIKVGELRSALQMVMITVDRRQGSELGYVYLSAKKGKGEISSRLLLYSTDSIGRFLVRVPCEVEEVGDLVVEPIRLTSLIERRADEEMVVFSKDAASNRVIARCGSARATLSSVGKASSFEGNINDFPHTAPPTFSIEIGNLKKLLDRTQSFIFRKDGQEHLKAIQIRTTATGYEAVATNREVVALADVEDASSPKLDAEGKPVVLVEIPGRALSALSKMLIRKKEGVIRVIVTKNTEGTPVSVYFRTEDAFFGNNLSASTLPSVDVVFSKQKMDTSVTINRAELLDSLNRSNPFCSESSVGRLVTVEVKDQVVRLAAQDAHGEFEEEIAVETPAEGSGKASFQVSYLADALNGSQEDDVLLKLGTTGPAERPSALLLSAGSTYVVGTIGAR